MPAQVAGCASLPTAGPVWLQGPVSGASTVPVPAHYGLQAAARGRGAQGRTDTPQNRRTHAPTVGVENLAEIRP